MICTIKTEHLQYITEYASQYGTERACAKFNVSADTIRRYANELRKRGYIKKNEVVSEVKEKDTWKQTVISTHRFTTVEELAEFCEIDLTVWEAGKIKSNQWNTSGEFTSWQFTVEWKRIQGITPEIVRRSIRDFIDAYEYPVLPEYTYAEGNTMLEVQIPDLHIGRHSSDYSMQTAYDRYMDAHRFFYERNKDRDIEKVLLMIGSDFMNSDTVGGTTTSGTPQSDENNYKYLFDMAVKTAVDAVEFWRSKGYTIEVKIVQGNHDELRMYSLGCLLDKLYEQTEQVDVDNSHNPRKYCVYGINMIGMTHGKKDFKQLKTVYQSEMREYLSQCTNIEMHIGHTHSERMVEDYGSVLIRTIPSLAQNSDWENDHGYTGNRRPQTFVWHKTDGLLEIQYYTP